MIPVRRHIAVLFMLLIASSMYAVKKPVVNVGDGRVTFAVDPVPLTDNPLKYMNSGDEIAAEYFYSDGMTLVQEPFEPKVLACSFGSEQLYDIGPYVVFDMLKTAWMQHRPVALSPDDVWLLICQGLSYQINKDSEKFRDRLVSHSGKHTLTVDSGNLLADNAEWSRTVSCFVDSITTHSKGDFARTMVADFSTTGENERIASQITLMDMVKPYFEYEAVYAICGIPSVTVLGNPADWRKIQQQARILDEFDLDWWLEDLEPILEEFVKASEGKPAISFWQEMVKRRKVDEFNGPSCVKKVRIQTEFDGWFLKLFPFDADGRTPKSVRLGHQMLLESVTVPFTFIVTDAAGNVLSKTPMQLVSGFFGVTQDPETYTLRPKIGWFARTCETEEQFARRQSVSDSIFKSESIFIPAPPAPAVPKKAYSNSKEPEWLPALSIGFSMLFLLLNRN